MTYLERITYLVGNFMQLSQYALKNAYRVVFLSENSKRVNEYTKGDELLVLSEEQAKKACQENFQKGSLELESYFANKGLSNVDYKKLVSILKKRDYVANLFFIDNSYVLSKEEVAVYESKINELQEMIKDTSSLIGKLAKTSEKLYSNFQK